MARLIVDMKRGAGADLTPGICCPGGMFTALQYEPWQLRRARSAGHHCGKFSFHYFLQGIGF